MLLVVSTVLAFPAMCVAVYLMRVVAVLGLAVAVYAVIKLAREIMESKS
jgi:hypothetical protein